MKVIHLPAIPDGDEPVCPSDAPNMVACDLFWSFALAYAVREGATALSFHPWRSRADGEGALTCTIGDVLFEMPAPNSAPEFTGQLIAAARRLATTGPVARLRAWLTGGAVGRLRLVAASGVSDWCVVTWASGRLAGTEFLRLSPLPQAVGMADSAPRT